MGGYYLPFGPEIELGQTFGSNPGWGPNPPGGHNGDDWKSPVGVPVRAAGDGEVVFAGRFDSTYADNWGWNLNFGGQMVVLNMDGDTAPYFEYGHMSQINVKTGDRVKAGQIIGLSGKDDGGTGVITGPHLHVGCLPYNYNLGTNTYGRVNPRIYMTEYWPEDGIEPQGSITIQQQEDELSADMPMKSKDGKNVTLEIVLNSIDSKVDGLPKFDQQVREDLANKGAQISALTAAVESLAGLVGQEQGLDVAAVKQAVTEAVAAGLKFTLEVKPQEVAQ